jgi:hypothetical protein
LALCGHSAVAGAVERLTTSEKLDFDSTESWAMKYFASVTLMTSMGPPRPLHLGSVRVMLEGDWIPAISDSDRVVGFNGTKSEDLNRLPAIGRLRVSVGLGWKLSLTVSYLPPISIHGVEPNIFSASLGRPFQLGRDFTVGAALYGQAGVIEGSFTCSTSEARAPINTPENPLGCLQPSNDHLYVYYFGAEFSASYRIRPAHDLEPYVTVGVNYLNLGFKVGARYDDVLDETRQSTQGATFSTTGGLLFPITHKLDIGSEVFYSPLTVKRPVNDYRTTVEGLLNVRAMIAYRFN